LFMLAITGLTSIVCVLVPVFQLSYARLAGRIENRAAKASRARARQWFIVAQVAMSFVLLAGAGLLVRSLRELQRNQGGFSVERVSLLRMRGMASGPGLGELYSRYLLRIAELPGIEAVGASSNVLPGPPSTRFTILGPGSSNADPARQEASYQIVSGGYFNALGIVLEEGRLFTDDDSEGRPGVVIVNREMADLLWPGRSPLGQMIRAGTGPRDATMMVVGVVGNVRPPLQVSDVPQLYVSYRQQSEPNIALLVRTRPGMSLPVADIKQAIRGVDARQAVFGITTADEWLSRVTASQYAVAMLTATFAALAVTMSVAGLYIVVTYVASQRSREIAIRRAFGAPAAAIVWSVSAPTVRWTIVGLGIGTFGAIASTRVLRASLSGVSALDTSLLMLVGALYAAVVLAVIVAATRRALSAQPMSVLRRD
jgi:predicted permease